MPLPAPDPTVLHPVAGKSAWSFLRPLVQSANVEIGERQSGGRRPLALLEADVERLLRAAWRNWPIELVTENARAIMTGTAAELERIAAEHGLRGP